MAADCAARRGGQVLVIEALTSDEWTELSAEDFESRYIRSSKPVAGPALLHYFYTSWSPPLCSSA